jgi:hypothetical protein
MLREVRGSALLEFSLVLPLLVVFVVGIYDFSGAFNQKQKMEQAAQEGAIIAGAQPMSDINPLNPNINGPDSLQPVVEVVVSSMAGNGILTPSASCTAASAVTTKTGPLQWTYAISGCPHILNIIIDRGWVPAGPQPKTVGTTLVVKYPYIWRFNSVIQLLFPGASYSPTTTLSETAAVHNQL